MGTASVGGDTAASERGTATPQFVLAAGLSLLLFVAFANLIVFQYGRGVVRAARCERQDRNHRPYPSGGAHQRLEMGR